MPTGITFENGHDLTCKCFLLALNHSLEMVRDIPEEFIIFEEYTVGSPSGQRKVMTEIGRVSLSEFTDHNGFACCEFMHSWPTGEEPHRLQIFYRSLDPNDLQQAVAASPLLHLDFWSAAWSPEDLTAEQIQKDAREGKFWAAHPMSSPGRWHLAHRFEEINDIAVIYLWRFEAPAFFEMHSHVQSNHCSPLPPAWIHTWEATIESNLLNFNYPWQDRLLSMPVAGKGEMAKISTKPTEEIATRFRKDFSEGNYKTIFPFLSPDADLIACLMPMDMEFMHFNGYFGVPVSQVLPSIDAISKTITDVRWYCWNKIWKAQTNNRDIAGAKGAVASHARFHITPPSSKEGEVWCWMGEEDNARYQDWGKQFSIYSDLFKSARNSPRFLPLFHFDPRRYAPRANAYTTMELKNLGSAPPASLDQVLSQAVQSSRYAGNSPFFGFKLYTAMGWAPLDPFLRNPLQRFYAECERDQIPLLNHCTPGGYYTHDRRHYYDLLHDKKKVVPGNDDETDIEGWILRFADRVPGPDGRPFSPIAEKEESWGHSWAQERVWWFNHHYVSAQGWAKVLALYPKLKLCLAHLGDSDHLRDNAWGARKSREPHIRGRTGFDPRKQLTFGVDGSRIDPNRTHKFLHDLIDLIQPSNNVFLDLSYVILNEHNAATFTKLFQWAHDHKPILLERILWGTDWPLVGDEAPVKNSNPAVRLLMGDDPKPGNMLHRYAQGFKAAVPGIPSDFFLRACFLNPLQYLDLKRIRATVGSGWKWIDDLDERCFSMDFSGDKTALLYQSNKSLKVPLET